MVFTCSSRQLIPERLHVCLPTSSAQQRAAGSGFDLTIDSLMFAPRAVCSASESAFLSSSGASGDSTPPPSRRSNNSVSVLSRFRVGVANPLLRLAGVRLCVFVGGVHCFGPLKAPSSLPDGFSCRQVLHLQRKQNLLPPSQPPTSCSATDQRGVFTHSCPWYCIGCVVWTSNAPLMTPDDLTGRDSGPVCPW